MGGFSIRDEFPELPRFSKISVCVLAWNAGTYFPEGNIFIRSEVISVYAMKEADIVLTVTNH